MKEIEIKLLASDEFIDAVAERVKLQKEIKPQEKFYSIKEVSNIVGSHRETIIRHIKAGILQANKIGGSYKITQKQLDEYANNES